MRLSPPQAPSIRTRVEFARAELADLEEFGGIDWVAYQSDRTLRRNVERIAENAANAAVDGAKILLAATEASVPATYRAVVEATVPAGLADAPTAAELVRLAQLRTALSHRYLDYKWDGLKWFLGSGRSVVAQWLAACERIAAASEEREQPDPPA